MPPRKYFTEEQRLEAGREYARRYRARHPERAALTQERAVQRVRASLATDPNDARHGTNYGYVAGCRCDPCTTASRERGRIYRAKRREDEDRERWERQPDPRYAQVKELREKNVTNAEIAQILGFSDRRTVGRIAMRLGLPRRKAGRRKKA